MVVDPFRVSVICVKCPLTGLESVMVAVTGFGDAAAQLGTQLSMSDVPVPVAPVAVHVQVRLVTTFVASPLKAISVGSVPV